MEYRSYVYRNGHWVRSPWRERGHKAIIYTLYVLALLVGTAIGPYTLGYIVWD